MALYKDTVDRLTRLLLLNASFSGDAGLMHGKTGISLLFFILSERTGNRLYREFAEELIDQVYEDISPDTPHNFEHGIAGIGWGIEFLVRHGFMEANTNEILADFDLAIADHVQNKADAWSVDDLIAGLYLASRYEKSKADGSSFQIIAQALATVTGNFKQGLCRTEDMPVHKAVLLLEFAVRLAGIPEFASNATQAKKEVVPFFEDRADRRDCFKEMIVSQAVLLQMADSEKNGCSINSYKVLSGKISREQLYTDSAPFTVEDCLHIVMALHRLFGLTSDIKFKSGVRHWLAEAIQLGEVAAGSHGYDVFDPARKVPLGLAGGLAGIVYCVITTDRRWYV